MVNILGYDIYCGDRNELLQSIFKSDHKIHIISGNPEVLYNGMNDPLLLQNFKSGNSIIIPDGIGVIISAKILHKNIKEKIAGIEIMEDIIKICSEQNKSIYLLGTKQDVLDKCIVNIKNRYPKIKIAGSHDGYFDIKNCEAILDDIKEKKPYGIFVAMGCPKQELFIANYMDKLPCTIFMGVGGSFDVFAGEVKRAPKWMINIGLEWLYRVLKEPARIRRLGSIPKFIFKAITYK